MLRRISSDDGRFKTIDFTDGVNLLLADKDRDSAQTASRNGAGKSSLVEIIHFLLGSKVDKNSLVSQRPIKDTTFDLFLDWPGLQSEYLRVSRTGGSANRVILRPDVATQRSSSEVEVSLVEWQNLIEKSLFGLTGDHPGISGRALLSLYARRVNSNAFNEPVKTSPQQSPADASANISYLLGLDWQLASQYRDLSARESMRRRLVQATKDPVWGKIVGRSSELRGQITSAQQRVQDLARQVEAFRVVPEYENLQRRADEIGESIRQTRVEDTIDRRNLQDLERALDEAVDPDVDYLEQAYTELGITLPNLVTKRFDEVREFHSSVTRNRRSYLQSEVESLRERLAEREAQRVILGEQQAALLRTLNEGGALQALTALQQSLAQERAGLEALRHRFEAAQALEASSTEIRAARSQLESEVRTDLREREEIIEAVNVLFLKYASRLYGAGRDAYLEIDPSPTHLRIVPHIDSEGSRGIKSMVIFCFDLTIAVIAKRMGRGPDFLIHDSHIFDGVDERQVSQAFALAEEVCAQESLQYIATMNSDDYDTKVFRQGVDLTNSIIGPRLTDEFENGGLFGFRFAA